MYRPLAVSYVLWLRRHCDESAKLVHAQVCCGLERNPKCSVDPFAGGVSGVYEYRLAVALHVGLPAAENDACPVPSVENAPLPISDRIDVCRGFPESLFAETEEIFCDHRLHAREAFRELLGGILGGKDEEDHVVPIILASALLVGTVGEAIALPLKVEQKLQRRCAPDGLDNFLALGRSGIPLGRLPFELPDRHRDVRKSSQAKL